MSQSNWTTDQETLYELICAFEVPDWVIGLPKTLYRADIRAHVEADPEHCRKRLLERIEFTLRQGLESPDSARRPNRRAIEGLVEKADELGVALDGLSLAGVLVT